MSDEEVPPLPEGISPADMLAGMPLELQEIMRRMMGLRSTPAVLDLVSEDDSVPNDWDAVFETLLEQDWPLDEREAAVNTLMIKRQTLWRSYHDYAVYQVRHLSKHLRNAGVPQPDINAFVNVVDSLTAMAMLFGRAHLEQTIRIGEHIPEADLQGIGDTKTDPIYTKDHVSNSFGLLAESLTKSWYATQFPMILDQIIPDLEKDDLSDIPCQD